MIQAVDSTLAQVEAVAGWYKIWTTKQNLEKLFAIMEIDFSEFEGDIEQQDDLYCIYVGKSYHSLRTRLKQHINGISTFGNSLKSIFAQRTAEKDAAAKEFMRNVWFEFGYKKDLKEPLAVREAKLINEKLRILNLDSNEHVKAEVFIKKLHNFRKNNNI